jgi:hypothetical protein
VLGIISAMQLSSRVFHVQLTAPKNEHLKPVPAIVLIIYSQSNRQITVCLMITVPPVMLVAQSGADVQAVDHDGWSSIHHACLGGNISCVQLLLTYGAPLHHKDKVSFRLNSSHQLSQRKHKYSPIYFPCVSLILHRAHSLELALFSTDLREPQFQTQILCDTVAVGVASVILFCQLFLIFLKTVE